MLLSISLLFLRIICEYVGLIYEEVRQRPDLLVSEIVDFQDQDPSN
jgi:hypothetical protein